MLHAKAKIQSDVSLAKKTKLMFLVWALSVLQSVSLRIRGSIPQCFALHLLRLACNLFSLFSLPEGP